MPGHRQTLHDDELTPLGRAKRHSERCAAIFGFGWVELCALTVLVARFRCGHHVTSRLTVDEFIGEEEGLVLSNNALRNLERLAMVRDVGRLNGAITWEPTILGLQKLEWAGRERAQGAAE